ncbi:hypothetical protein PV08_10505 [Exophiala spinifera]|uniref:SprT-like domain-containing protein n=1 Tax=Exophiala spinifera TaxID=91928 RepID=A0A0D2AXL8_9EURO|nr:uncharacterized protein PV08_10505 [Exophiala spinifera]KIW11205.1 hypothetical protein PV08_10505 [Exophiala spinifera]
MSLYLSDDDLPDLAAIVAPRPLMATSTNASVRRSPRKKAGPAVCESRSPHKKDTTVKSLIQEPQIHLESHQTSGRSPAKRTKPPKAASIVDAIPNLPRNSSTTEMLLTSNNRRSAASPQSSLRLTHVASLRLPQKSVAMGEGEDQEEQTVSRLVLDTHRLQSNDAGSMSRMSRITEAARRSAPEKTRKQKAAGSLASRFVLKEARCNDDVESSMDEEDEDEDTDLSGFIVDDNADLSYYGTSASEADDDWVAPTQQPRRASPRKRLHRGRRSLQRREPEEGSYSEKENRINGGLADALRNMRLKEDTNEVKEKIVEVIDLTTSPLTSPKLISTTAQPINSPQFIDSKKPPTFTGTINVFDAPIKLAPPSEKPSLIDTPQLAGVSAMEKTEDQVPSEIPANNEVKTPPATPPKSPVKLKSPSKLLSPSKRQLIPRSPHRQSTDAFWDHNTVNEWIDEYSPKKAPATSPKKVGLARYQIWSDSEEDQDEDMTISDSFPSPCTSPRKAGGKGRSPTKSPEKEEKKRQAEEKRAAMSRKRNFDSSKVQLAIDLLRELDVGVADSQLGRLAASTGGVKIIWSKTLRSTAGRANWKRTVTKLSGSPIKGGEVSVPGVKVQHFASIELAEKIIDCEDRLVNTVAHEFCHLTNFMISNVRDQPHGASFKQWAAKVTCHLRKSQVEIWRQVEVTTKHSYVINHKYLWVCAGRERSAAMAFLNIEEDEGCGAEYGRHSKSIDPEKHRCGKCKGRLVQVRPKPRASPRKKLLDAPVKKGREGSTDSTTSSNSSSRMSAGSDSTGTVGRMIDYVELSD